MSKIFELIDKLKKNQTSRVILEASKFGMIEFEASYDYSNTLIEAIIKTCSTNPNGELKLTSETHFLNNRETILKDCEAHFQRISKEYEKERNVLSWFGLEPIGYDHYQSEHLFLIRVKEGSPKFGSVPIKIHIVERNDLSNDVVVMRKRNFLEALIEYGKTNPMNFALLPSKLRDLCSKKS